MEKLSFLKLIVESITTFCTAGVLIIHFLQLRPVARNIEFEQKLILNPEKMLESLLNLGVLTTERRRKE